MSVYVDDARISYRSMKISYMWADTLDELLAMADRIGVARKWLQFPPGASWTHFDIAQSKRALAIRLGAVETDRYGPVEHIARLKCDAAKLDQIASIRAKFAEQR